MTPVRPPQNGLDDAQSVDLEHIRVLRLQPGDTIALTAPGPISAADADRLVNAIHERFPDNPALVLSRGIEIAAAHPDKDVLDRLILDSLRRLQAQGRITGGRE
jgi:hypothetical protein